MEESHEKQLGAASTTQLYAERGSLHDGILGSSKAAWSTRATERPVKSMGSQKNLCKAFSPHAGFKYVCKQCCGPLASMKFMAAVFTGRLLFI